MKIIIVASSPVKSFKDYYHLNPSDFFIGIDQGAIELINRGIKPDVAIGDFDSTNDLAYIEENSYKVLKYNKDKDETDLELAFKYLDQLKGSENLEIDVYDATSARLDHEFNTYMLMAKYSLYKIRVVDINNEVIYMKDNDKYQIKRPYCKYFSLCPIKESVVTVNNAKYILNDVTLKTTDTYAVSNEPLNDGTKPTINVIKGGILLFSYYENK